MKYKNFIESNIRLLTKSILTGIIYFAIYFLIVILTTPNFPPLVSASIALEINGIYVIGSTLSISLQTFLVGYSQSIPLQLGIPKIRSSGLNVLGSIASAFFSFFALIGVGCCGTWLLIISQFPGILGVGLSSVLTQYSTLFAQIGLILMVISNIYTYLQIRKKLRIYKSSVVKT